MVAEVVAGTAILVWAGWCVYPGPHDVDGGWLARKSYEFSADEVGLLIQSARRLQPPVELRDPGSISAGHCTYSKKSSRDPGKVVGAFPTLHLRSGFVLRAYESWFGLDACGRVFALPEGSPFPEPDPDASTVPAPPGALHNPMLAIEGDGRVPVVAARTWIDRADDQRRGGEPRAGASAGDAHAAVLQRLAQRLERAAAKLRQLVEKEHAVVREARLPGARHVAAADESGVRHRMVRGPKWACGDDPHVGVDEPRNGVDGRRLDRLVEGERGQYRGQCAGEQRLAPAGEADHEEVVATTTHRRRPCRNAPAGARILATRRLSSTFRPLRSCHDVGPELDFPESTPKLVRVNIQP